MPRNIASEKWGTEDDNQTYTGLISEAMQGKAAFYLGDLHYTLQHLNYFDLTIPYNTECLTFLTPESLTINSWKLLILPFKYVQIERSAKKGRRKCTYFGLQTLYLDRTSPYIDFGRHCILLLIGIL